MSLHLVKDGLRAMADRLVAPPFKAWLTRNYSDKVITGPFRGMHYVEKSLCSTYFPKILGTFELELQDTLQRLAKRDFKNIVNVGAAEGYYAVGLALYFPQARVTAFEIEPAGQELVKKMALNNGVSERISVHGRCDKPDLVEALQGRDNVLVVADVEGFEAVLIDTESIPDLKRAYLVCETHDAYVPGVTRKLLEHLKTTHRVEEIPALRRKASDMPVKLPWWLSMWGSFVPRWALLERRAAGISWIVAEPLAPK
jgi:hypothetical protein